MYICIYVFNCRAFEKLTTNPERERERERETERERERERDDNKVQQIVLEFSINILNFK